MKLTAYVQASGPRVIQLWVGVFETEAPPAPVFTIDQQAAQAQIIVPMSPIRDKRVGAGGLPVNHRGIYRFAAADAGQPHQVEVRVGAERKVLATCTLPDEVPASLDGSFNILVCSCYFQPEDKEGLLGSIVSQIQIQPHLTLMAGDQVYLDLPLLEDLPEQDPAMSQMLGDKYIRNWASSAFQVPGLEAVLGRAPVVNIPDDHEFWNNFPYPQKQLPNLWDPDVLKRWRLAARELYEDYQLAVPANQSGATRLDVAPLKMLFVDMRTDRDELFQVLMNQRALDALEQWKNDLIAARAAGPPGIGLLSSGQALFITPPSDESKKRDVDAEMGNYAQFKVIEKALAELADHGIPVVYVTGDVHWGRVAGAEDQVNGGRSAIYEVIASPSRLIRVPFLDTAKESGNALKGIFGKQDPWPRHGDPDKPPSAFGSAKRFIPKSLHGQRGDHVAIVSFTRAGTGVDFSVSYYGIHKDYALARSRQVGPFALRQM